MPHWGQEILDFWAELSADLSVKRDNFGRVRGQELRPNVPLKRQAISDRTSFHTKLLEQRTKDQKNLTDAELEATMCCSTHAWHAVAIVQEIQFGGVCSCVFRHL